MEALIDFSAQFAETISPRELDIDPERVLGAGASSLPLRDFHAEFVFAPDDPTDASAHTGLVGYRFQSAQADRVVQFHVEGMTYSVVGGYTTWDDLERGAVAAFGVYQETVGASVPVRPATRFINRIEIPFGTPLDQFLLVAPAVPAGFRVGITAFRTETHFWNEGNGLAATLTVSTAGAAEDASVGVVFLDVSVRSEKAFAFSASEALPDDLALELGGIRDTKNSVFFGSLCPQALARYRDTP